MNPEMKKMPSAGRKTVNMGPPKRSREAPVHEDFWEKQPSARTAYGPFRIELPDDVTDPAAYAESLWGGRDLPGAEEVLKRAGLPDKRLTVCRWWDDTPLPEQKDMLTHALILARCGKTFFYPDTAPVFTRKRLNRCVMLLDINKEEFYEMES